jgi:hypothetical protein
MAPCGQRAHHVYRKWNSGQRASQAPSAAGQGLCRAYLLLKSSSALNNSDDWSFTGGTIAIASRSGGWLGARAPLRHELIELGFVLRRPQASEEVLKFPLFLFEAPQGFLTIVVEDAVAA